jgi:hypothetical protein
LIELERKMTKSVATKAMSAWNKYLESYPESRVNKAFLQNNAGIVSTLIEAVMPDVLENTMSLESEIEDMGQYIEALLTDKLREFAALASIIDVSASQLESYGDLENTNEQIENIGSPFQFVAIAVRDEDVVVDLSKLSEAEDVDSAEAVDTDDADLVIVRTPKGDVAVRSGTQLPEPLWLVTATMPSGSVSPILVTHAEFVKHSNSSVAVVPVHDNALFRFKRKSVTANKSPTDALLEELGFCVGESESNPDR